MFLLYASQSDLGHKAEASGCSYLSKRDITIELQALNELSASSTVVAVARILFSLLLIFVSMSPFLCRLQHGRSLGAEPTVQSEADTLTAPSLSPSSE